MVNSIGLRPFGDKILPDSLEAWCQVPKVVKLGVDGNMLGKRLIKIALLGSLWLFAISGGMEIMGEAGDHDAGAAAGKEVITVGGGCFWCIEAVFDELKGVDKVVSGYSGGRVANPTYEQVCGGGTGHAEVVQITFDPQVISLKQLLGIFFTVHDPTTLNRQGADAGTQYRSVIFYLDEQQKAVAEQTIKEVQAAGIWDGRVVTELVPFKTFYRAEDYHQRYFELNGQQPYCRVVIAPKVLKFREHYRTLLRE
jgi:peptide-methionine (S)-S-oxide reductase